MEKITDSNILTATRSWQRESFLNEHASFDKSRFTYIPRGYIPSSRFSRHDLFECYSRNDISSFLRPSTGKASNSGSRTWTLKSWQTREERRRGTSVSTTCRIGRLPSDPYVQPVTCYQSRFRTICPLLPRFPLFTFLAPEFFRVQFEFAALCTIATRPFVRLWEINCANERTMGWSFSSVFKCDTTQSIIETPFYTFIREAKRFPPNDYRQPFKRDLII